MKKVSENLLKFLITTVGRLFISFFIAPIIATMIGMFTGMVVGWFGFIADPILSFFGCLGVDLQLWEIGGVIGFIGGFLSRLNYNVRMP